MDSGVVPKHGKDTEETSELLTSFMSINETSSIIFQFAPSLKTLRCKYSGTSQYPAHAHKHTYTCRLADANWWLAQEAFSYSTLH